MLDPGSRYHQALRERVTNNAREQLEQNSYKKDIDELDALYLDEPSPTIATKAKKKKKRKKNGGDRLEVSEAQGSSSTSVVQKREEKQPPIPLLADPVLPVVAAVSSSSENFQVVSYHRPRTEPVEGEGNKKVNHTIVPWMMPGSSVDHLAASERKRNIDRKQVKEALDSATVYGEARPKRMGSEKRYLSWKAVAGMDKVRVQSPEQREGIAVIHLQTRDYFRQETVTTFPCSERRARNLLLHPESRFDRRLGEHNQ